jgi:signal transduction histidine kinase
MLVAHPIVAYSALIAAVAATGVGFAAMWSNPDRRINKLFFSASLHAAIWLVCRYLAVVEEELVWVRMANAVGAMMHFHLWLIKETVSQSEERFAKKILRGRTWLGIGILLAAITFTDWFIPSPIEPGVALRRYGPAYYIYLASLVFVFLALCAETVQEIRKQVGVTRLELQLLMFGGSATALVTIAFMTIQVVVGTSWIPLVVPFVVILFYSATVVAITTSRIFNARQLFFVGLQRISLISIVALAVYGADVVFNSIFSSPLTLVLTVAMALWLSTIINNWFDLRFQFYPQGHTARQAAYSAAQQERRSEHLIKAFYGILQGWGQTERALVVSRPKIARSENAGVRDKETEVINVMRELRWATPERLLRERQTVERKLVADYLSKKHLGVLVIEEGVTLSVLVGVGVGAARRPFTYPQVNQLMELGSIIASALERAHYSAKVQHTEQLATVGLLGASLAHEIRNPLVSIKTFVQLLPTHYQDAAFREKFFRLISDEVGRIDQLTDQLLDLAAPRAYIAQTIELHPLLQASLDLVAARAAHRQVELITEFNANPDNAYTDASAAKQVMLNLCFNAIQAIDGSQKEERWVKVATRNVPAGIEMAVADSGPGISPEIRPRLFQPFQTTKSNGFGLGLAICSDILTNLQATISVDSSAPGEGATFRVTFPCQPSSF